MSTVTSSLANPYKLNEEELRQALDRANCTMLAQTLQIADLQQQVSVLSSTVGNLCQLTIEGSYDKVSAELARLAANYQRLTIALATRKMH